MAEARGTVTMIHTLLSGVKLNVGQAYDTSTCFIETKDLDFGQQDVFKFLKQVFAAISDLDQAANLRLYIKWRNSLVSPLQISPAITFNQLQNTSFRVPGARFYRIRIEDVGVLVTWRLSKLELFGTAGGRRA